MDQNNNSVPFSWDYGDDPDDYKHKEIEEWTIQHQQFQASLENCKQTKHKP